ncbi:MAG TPA: right-handed parallel beta-helix repeat-containing protein [Fimbriimonadaceae bacterium]|nr:right-handed parallel beta-helix repeat-containing protein [Fimbriimonadaceae bacterium]
MIASLLLGQIVVTPKDDLAISSNFKVKPGIYRLDDVKGDGLFKVTKDGIKIDFTGAKFIGKGTLMNLSGRQRVHIVGLHGQGYEGGLKVSACSKITIEDADARLKLNESTKCDILFTKSEALSANKCDDLFALGIETKSAVVLSNSDRVLLGYVKAPGFRLDTVTVGTLFRVESNQTPVGAELVNCTSIHSQYCDFLQGDVGIRIQGGEDNWVLNSNIRNHRIGVELVKTREAVIGANTIRDCSAYAVEVSGAGDIYFESNAVKNAPIPPTFSPLEEHSEEYHHREWLRTVVDRAKELWQKRLGR